VRRKYVEAIINKSIVLEVGVKTDVCNIAAGEKYNTKFYPKSV